MDPLNKLYMMFNNSVEFLALSVLLAGASLAATSWKKSFGYFIASVITGTTMGYAAYNTPYVQDFSHMISAMGAGLGAATLAYISDKDLLKILKEYLAIKKDPTKELHVKAEDIKPE